MDGTCLHHTQHGSINVSEKIKTIKPNSTFGQCLLILWNQKCALVWMHGPKELKVVTSPSAITCHDDPRPARCHPTDPSVPSRVAGWPRCRGAQRVRSTTRSSRVRLRFSGQSVCPPERRLASHRAQTLAIVHRDVSPPCRVLGFLPTSAFRIQLDEGQTPGATSTATNIHC